MHGIAPSKDGYNSTVISVFIFVIINNIIKRKPHVLIEY